MKEHPVKQDAKHTWTTEFSEHDGIMQCVVVKWTLFGTPVSMYEVGNPIPIHDDHFPFLKRHLTERANRQVDELNS